MLTRDVPAALGAPLRRLLEHAETPCCLHRGGAICWANAEMAGLVGREDGAALVGVSVGGLVHPLDQDRVRARISALEVGDREATPRVELRMLRVDGSASFAEVWSMRVDEGDPPLVLTMARDVRRERAAEVRLAQSDRLASIGTLAAGVAHEINNPLTYVTLNLEDIQRLLGPLVRDATTLRDRLVSALSAERAAELLKDVEHVVDAGHLADLRALTDEALGGSRRVAAIVQDLRRFTHVSGDEPHCADPNSALRGAVNLCMHELKYRAKVTCDLGPVHAVRADEGRLVQVFVNLLVNAAQAMQSDDASRNEIAIRSSLVGDMVEITVRDSGEGIPPEKLGRLFDPLYTTKAPGEGSGLGLSICRHIVEGFGGRISVESEVGVGTVFSVSLPTGEALAPAASKPEPEPVKGVGGVEQARLLIVDDEPGVRRTLGRLLARQYRVESAPSGKDAMERLSMWPGIDLVLSDLVMPGCTGGELHTWLGLHRPDLQPFVVYMTGGVVSASGRGFLDSVPNTCLEKPLDVRRLRAVLADLAQKRRSPPGSERRAGPRFTGGPLVARILHEQRDQVCRVVDFSASGLRVAAGDALPLGRPGELVELLLRRGQGREEVHVGGRIMRRAMSHRGEDLCLRLSGFAARDAAVYAGWLKAAAA